MSSQPTFREALSFWHKLGWISFGGVAGQLAIMQTELVDRRGWIDQRAYLQGLNFATLLPGPEAQQLATYIGWRLHGWRGGLAAGALFIIPGAIIMWALSWLLAAQGDAGPVAAFMSGIKPVVVGIVAVAVLRIGVKALKSLEGLALAVLAFVALWFAGIDFPWVVLAAGLYGALRPAPAHVAAGEAVALPPGGVGRAVQLVLLFAALWAAPVVVVLWAFGLDPFVEIARLFTIAAFVTFGGAYAVLPYIAEAAVNDYGWLTAAEMVNGLALAETRPGPTILVLQYVGFLAGWKQAAGDPLLAATVAAFLTTYLTFLPSFLFIFLGAPYIAWIGGVRWAAGALAAITAAVVGVMANLAAFLGQAVLFPVGQFAAVDAVVAVVAFLLLWRLKLAVHWLVLLGAAWGAVRGLLLV